jgi:hypothetical membrane protein
VKFNPYMMLAGIIGVVFVVWLFTSMAVTAFANRILLTLVICSVLIGVAGALSMVGNPGGDRDEEKSS